MSSYSILIVDDEILTLNNLKKMLEKEDYEVLVTNSGESALEMFERYKPQLVLLDLMLPGISGIEVLKRIKELERETIVIMMSAYEILEKAVESMKLGAYDYLLKPFKVSDLKNTIRRALETLSLRIRVREHLESEKGRYYFGKIIAESKKMKEVVRLAKRVAGSEKTTVLLEGESGTGKELLAKAIHYHSPRAEKPLVEINCAAIPENLLESELFGYEAGAFTDAKKRKIGLLERADGGTVFFDEIGDMSLNLQAKLLRVLEEETFARLGGTQPIKVNLRVIAATNQDLARATEKGQFRSDLFYRLNVVPVLIPPLRERKEDILPLTLLFIQEFNQELRRAYRGISQEAAQAMLSYPWPGNVRELKNIIERIMSLYPEEEVRPGHLPAEIQDYRASPESEILEKLAPGESLPTLEELEKLYITKVLALTGQNKTRAAKILGIHPTSLFRKLKSRDPS
ncbi:MAG: sigma-54-dependent Fis family transcriptional regulator [Candidatus Aminicenantes bacterium]|nr:sigma-54-dependent Fis family transcriptional regulator [Candidatus Aminicenantes bacterium]